MQIAAGSRWASTTSATEIVVVRPATGPVTLRCGGEPMVLAADAPADRSASSAASVEGLELGKRYTDSASGLQLLCVKVGAGIVEVDGRPVERLAAKPLPASD